MIAQYLYANWQNFAQALQDTYGEGAYNENTYQGLEAGSELTDTGNPVLLIVSIGCIIVAIAIIISLRRPKKYVAHKS